MQMGQSPLQKEKVVLQERLLQQETLQDQVPHPPLQKEGQRQVEKVEEEALLPILHPRWLLPEEI